MIPKGKNRVLAQVVAVSVLLHVAGLVIFGSLTVYRYMRPPEPEFVAPPPMERIEPQRLEYQARTRELQRSSARPRQQRIQVKGISDLNTPPIDVPLPELTPEITVGTGAMAGLGVGRGLGSGSLGAGQSAVEFFGLQSTGERIVIVVDVSASMIMEKRGGLSGFDQVRNEVSRAISGLSAATLFNLFAYAGAVDAYSEHLVPATHENKQRAIEWFAPYFAHSGDRLTGRRGVFRRNYQTQNPRLQPFTAGGTRTDLAMQVAFEMQADVVFLLTDGQPVVERGNPRRGETRRLNNNGVVDLIMDLARDTYGPGRSNLPSLMLIGYSIDRRTDEFLKHLQRQFPGADYRRLGIDQD